MSLANGGRGSQSQAVLTALRIVATASLLLIGCAPSGDDPRSRLTTWEAPGGDYRIRYLNPPWELAEEDAITFLRIQSNGNLVGSIDGGPGKYELHVTRESGEVASLMAGELRRLTAAGATIRVMPRTVETREGVSGQELLTFEATLPFERHRRIVLFPLGSGRVLRLAFEATPDLDTQEVDAMVAQVGIGPAL